jgi:uncharacterized protein (DUF1697 family)
MLHIALLRGVNVGGNKMVGMAGLRALAGKIGLKDPKTLLQSGNLVFQSDNRDGADLEALLESAVEKRLGLKVDFHVRTALEWTKLLAANPFPAEVKADPSHLLIFAFKEKLAPKSVQALRAAITGPEKIEADGRQLYAIFPAGIGKSRLTPVLMDRLLGIRGTGRNWNTALKLADMLVDCYRPVPKSPNDLIVPRTFTRSRRSPN